MDPRRSSLGRAIAIGPKSHKKDTMELEKHSLIVEVWELEEHRLIVDVWELEEHSLIVEVSCELLENHNHPLEDCNYFLEVPCG